MQRPACRYWVTLPLFLSLLPNAQAAPDTVIGFDNLAGVVSVGSQYASAGLTFVTSFGTPLPQVTATPLALSAPNVIRVGPSCAENCTSAIVGRFNSPRRRVRVSVGSLEAPEDVRQVQLTAYGADGSKVLDQGTATAAERVATVTGSSGLSTILEIERENPEIVFFQISAYPGRSVKAVLVIDDLTFDNPDTVTPAFCITWTGGLPVRVAAGGRANTPIHLIRSGGSAPVQIEATRLPPGITTKISPNPISVDGATARLEISAGADASPSASARVELTATTTPPDGSKPCVLTIPLTIQASYDARIVGIEVTQGIQSEELPRQGSDPSVPVSYLGGTIAGGSDRGVPLAAFGKTIVRVFANQRIPLYRDFHYPAFSARLHVCDRFGANCRTLQSETGLRPLSYGREYVTREARLDGIAFTFTLPPERTSGTITLRAELLREAEVFSDVSECQEFECYANDLFVLKDVGFYATPTLRLRPVELKINYESLRSPDSVFREARNLLPLADDGLQLLPTYQGQIGITDLEQKDADDSIDRSQRIVARLIDHADDWNFFDSPGLVMGVYDQDYEKRIRGLAVRPGSCGSTFLISGLCEIGATALGTVGIDVFGPAAAIASAPKADSMLNYTSKLLLPELVVRQHNRPLTSVTHEMFHLLGRPHAGPNCPDVRRAEDWPPDQKGQMYGIGLDRRGGTWQEASSGFLYKLVAPGIVRETQSRVGGPLFFYDLMSYCVEAGSGDPNAWTSVKGWTDMMQRFAGAVSFDNSANAISSKPAAARDARGKVPSLFVRALVSGSGNVEIAKIAPSVFAAVPDELLSEYRLIARDSEGKVMGETRMASSPAVGEEAGADAGLFLTAHTPAMTAARLEIVGGGVVLAFRDRPAALPRVSIESINSGGRIVEREPVTVRWQSNSAAGTQLTVKVDVGRGDEDRWRPVYLGPETGPERKEVSLPASLFPRATCGRIRVRVNDGFQEASAVSDCIELPGSIPLVRILSPSEGARTTAEASLLLSGEAYDDTGENIADERLRWKLNGALAGTGPRQSISGLPEGVSTLELEAEDGFGRTGRASMRLVCGSGAGGRSCTSEPLPAVFTTPNQITSHREIRLKAGAIDAGGPPLTFAWRSVSKSASILHANTATPDVQFSEGFGEYIFEVQATDPLGRTSISRVTITYVGR